MVSSEAINHQDHVYQGMIRVYENQLVDFVKDITNLVGKDEIGATLTAYLLVHPALTQQQMQELTGFSKGSISSKFTLLLKRGLVEKQRIPGTHTYQYYLCHLGRAFYSKMRMAKIGMQFLVDYLEMVREKINNLKNEDIELRAGILKRIQAFGKFWEIYQLAADETVNEMAKTMPPEEQSESEQEQAFPTTPVTSIPFPKESESLTGILQAITTVFRKLFHQFGFNKAYAHMLGAFFFVGEFTQKSLKTFTGLSTGTISKELQNLIDRGVIKRESAEGSSHFKYTILPLKDVLYSIFINPIKTILESMDTLDRIKQELEIHSEWRLMNGYHSIYTAIVQFKQFLPVYFQFLNILEAGIENLEFKA